MPPDGYVVPPEGYVVPDGGGGIEPLGYVMPPDGYVMPPEIVPDMTHVEPFHVPPPFLHMVAWSDKGIIPPEGYCALFDGYGPIPPDAG